MLLLTSTSDKIQIITGEARTIDVHASFVDYNGTTVTPGRQNTAISTAATTDVVSAPGSSTQRNLKTLNVRNKDVSTATITVQHTDGSVVPELYKVSLPANSEFQYVDGLGWMML